MLDISRCALVFDEKKYTYVHQLADEWVHWLVDELVIWLLHEKEGRNKYIRYFKLHTSI